MPDVSELEAEALPRALANVAEGDLRGRKRGESKTLRALSVLVARPLLCCRLTPGRAISGEPELWVVSGHR